ncbi:CU044_5270 family protein [Actinoplanes sp. NPDC049118]|uniref:CU044_5270 family protein n=1 Tax=Actinoplanes sp. NPDC049118 TaxID=3155769 RepID=UPI0033FB827B
MKSDLSVLEEFGASLAPMQDQPPAEVRHRVMNAMRPPARPPRLLSSLRGVRLAWRIGTPAVAAATVAVALVALNLPDDTRGRPAPPGATGVAARPDAVPPALPDAGQVLLLAAQHSAETPAMDARPNQFLFIDSFEVESRTDLHENRNGEIVSGKTTVSRPLRTRTWLSVDGTRDGLVIQEAAKSPVRTHIDGCTKGRQAQTIDRPETTPKVACTPEPAYQPGRVPTDADRLLAYVYTLAADRPVLVSVGSGPDGRPRGFVRLSADQRAFTGIAEILYKNHLPAVQEAAFRAAGRIPGVQVRRDVTDAAGRAGVAVTRTEAGTREELLFDPITYTYLGHNIIGAEFDPAGEQVLSSPDRRKGATRITRLGPNPKAGDVIYKSALLRVAIVDKAGKRP